MITITIKTDNDAFADGNKEIEVARILQEIAKDYAGGYAVRMTSTRTTYNDINGNKAATVDED